MKITKQNKELLVICHQLSVVRLSAKDREFINSLMHQAMRNPEKFTISEPQLNWLRDIWKQRRRVA